MSHATLSPEHLRQAFVPGQRGVVGLVEALLDLCRDQEEGFELDWRADRCCIRSLGAPPHHVTEVAMPRSVFRSILARIAALCNERVPGSISPYGGEGELSVGTSPATVFRVAFANTPGEQKLEVRCRPDHRNGVAEADAPAGSKT
jgi:hypothetical protein